MTDELKKRIQKEAEDYMNNFNNVFENTNINKYEIHEDVVIFYENGKVFSKEPIDKLLNKE